MSINQYSDIINLPHHVSKKHKSMSIKARAAQFGAFAALSGFEGKIEETAKKAMEKVEKENG